MSSNARSEFVDFVRPLRERLSVYDPSRPPHDQPKNDASDPAKAVPQGFLDAMTVREEVFVKEQGCALESELDDDDARSFHWTAYASIPIKESSAEADDGDPRRRASTSTKIPIGTIRLVPPPHPPHPNRDPEGTGKEEDNRTDVHDGKEPYVKIGRLAVIKEFRKAGISRLLMDTAIAFIRDSPHDIIPQSDPTKIEALKQEHSMGFEFRGLVLLHAQIGVQKLYRRYGFETDESMGTWVEEGIDHVGMWRRVESRADRRRSKTLAS